jgi:hypothetical protein
MGFKDGKAEPMILGSTNSQLDTRLKALAGVVTTIQNAGTALAVRVLKLESAPAGTDYSAQIAELNTRLTTLENKLCPQQAIIDALVADHTPDV